MPRRRRETYIVALAWLSFLFSMPKVFAADTADVEKGSCSTAAATMISALTRGEVEKATSGFDTNMKQALPGSVLSSVWSATIAKLGAYAGMGTVSIDHGDEQAPFVATVPLHFATGTVNGVVACNKSGEIAGFHLVVAEAPKQKPDVHSSDINGAVEIKTDAIRSGDIELGATFYRPKMKPPYPLVVLVGGSGPVDRDETIGSNKPMRDIALGLAKSGIATLAFDKRTFTFPQKPIATIDDEIVDDAVAAISHGSRLEGVDRDRFFLLGHSLGGTMAPRIAQRSSKKLTGLILLAPLMEPLDRAYLRQLYYLARLDGKFDDDERKVISAAEDDKVRLNELKMGHAPKGSLPLGIPASYWEDLWRYDLVAVAKEVRLPILALFAGRDYQVLAAESEGKLHASLSNTVSLKTHIYPTLGHTFMPMVDPPNPEVLLKPSQVSEVVINDVATWVLATSPRN